METQVVGAVRQAAGPAGFATLYATHNRQLVRFAYLLTGDPGLAEDLVADVFAQVLRGWGQHEIDNPQAYLRRAIANRFNSKLRRRYLARRHAHTADGSDRGVLRSDEQLAERDAMFQALDRLPEGQRTVVVLRYYEDLSVAETAEVLGVSQGTVKSQTARALDRLTTILATNDRSGANAGDAGPALCRRRGGRAMTTHDDRTDRTDRPTSSPPAGLAARPGTGRGDHARPVRAGPRQASRGTWLRRGLALAGAAAVVLAAVAIIPPLLPTRDPGLGIADTPEDAQPTADPTHRRPPRGAGRQCRLSDAVAAGRRGLRRRRRRRRLDPPDRTRADHRDPARGRVARCRDQQPHGALAIRFADGPLADRRPAAGSGADLRPARPGGRKRRRGDVLTARGRRGLDRGHDAARPAAGRRLRGAAGCRWSATCRPTSRSSTGPPGATRSSILASRPGRGRVAHPDGRQQRLRHRTD